MTAFEVPHLAAINSLPTGLLYPHQADGVSFLISKGRAILGDDMGLGKTRQVIIGMQIAAPTGMILVVCPASLKLNWRREIRMVDPDAKIEVLGVADGEQTDPRWVIVNYDLLAKNAERLHGIPWSGVILDEAHFIKNNSQRTAQCLKLLGISNDARAALIGPRQVYLLTGTPITNRPKDLFNLLRCVGHPSARSFISFAKQYCDAYKNGYGWVTTGASNLEELNLLMKEVMLRRKKDEVLNLPPKIRSWVPIAVKSAAALNAQRSFAQWFAASDASRPNDKDFLAHLTKVRVALHKAKHRAVEERIRDVISTDRKVIVFTAFTDGLKKHKAVFGDECVTISGSDNAEQRMEAVDRFQNDPGGSCSGLQHHRRRRRHHAHGRNACDLPRPRLGPGQSSAGRGPGLPDGSDRARNGRVHAGGWYFGRIHCRSPRNQAPPDWSSRIGGSANQISAR
jgi:SWI/SNF-related matrix-associated actin-dependent regulator 1 of chromatin subfamily A